jgi:LPXTG-motif cell wall-anchored protein
MYELRYARFAPLVPLVVLALANALSPPAAAQGQGTMTICAPTGSEASPWVYTTVEERRWPTYQAQGAYRASSAAECTAAPQHSGVAQPPPAIAQQPPGSLQQPPPVQDRRSDVGAETGTVVAPSVAQEAATASSPPGQLDVSQLPSTGEPDLPLPMLALLLLLGGIGFYLRWLGQWSIEPTLHRRR